jgi:hypothetical protein
MPKDPSDRRHERLWAIAGDWATSGRVISDPPLPVSGSDIYEILPAGYFLVHHVDVTVGSQAVRAIEVIGEAASRDGTFLARSYDNHGSSEVMELTIDYEGVFHFTGGPEIATVAQPASASTARVRSTPRGRIGPGLDDRALGTVRRWRQLGAVDAHDLHPETQPDRRQRKRLAAG